jgi:hypothetical protein
MQIALTPQRHRYIFIFGLLLLVLGMGWGAFPLSLAEIIIGVNWIWEGNFKWKWQKIKSTDVFWALTAFYFFHLAGMLWSEDYAYAVKDIKIKIPLFALPLIFVSTKSLTAREWKLVLSVFVFAIIASTFWSMVFYFGWRPLKENDVRQISRFDSHIRFALKILMAVFISGWFAVQKTSAIQRIAWIAAASWLIVFLFILSSLNGIVILVLLLFALTVITLFRRQRKSPGLVFLVFSMCVSVLVFVLVKREWNEFFTETEPMTADLTIKSPTGSEYYHEPGNTSRENGYLVWRFIAYGELAWGWNNLSEIKFDSLDKKGHPVKFTLIRYITSKGMRKDSLALAQLTKEDIQNIENSIPNYKLAGASRWRTRLYELFWEIDDYKRNGNVKGHSLMMKAEFWKAGWNIAKNNFVIGVGTGDIQKAFNGEYEASGSPLKTEQDRRRAHNQFLETLATHGVIGLSLLLILLFYPVIYSRGLHWLYTPFLVICIISMFTEDTLETQMGVSFFAFFNAFFIFLVPSKEAEDKNITQENQ